jgi:hypothetical protein
MTVKASGACGPITAGTPGFRIPAFSKAISSMVPPRNWTCRNRRDRGHAGLRDHVGRIEPAAESGFEQQDVGRLAREAEEGGRGGDLEIGDRGPAVGRLASLEQRGQVGFGDRAAGQADALVKAHQVRRGVDLHALAGCLQHGAQEGERRALAVGAGDVDHRRQLFLGVAEACEQALDPAEGEIDEFGMQPGEAVEDRVTSRHHRGSRRLPRVRPRRRAA